ncbi:TlyA family RNA methyltransferase [Cellulomonas sp. PhB150]|uniref:TlyA family RNA methyltransferase n=1 Tax=Cellulomonas sp. PhB150 TaxID=2485188 RepID=UPI000F4A74C6|nr:TlyA family RNA methyltransferase [Cellulomonas sp. PhB150]
MPGPARAAQPEPAGTTTRLDTELVRRGLARSRREAAELIAGGRVQVRGKVAGRSSMQVQDGDEVEVEGDADDRGYASRGAHKLVGALDATGIRVEGRLCLDAGASTGGFTDVLLRRGARRVVAVDVGHGQIIDRLRDDERVDVREGVNVRELRAGDVDPAPDLVVADLSFISLTMVLPALQAVAAPDADLLLMVKPQFEVGRERLGSGGVVRSPELRSDAVVEVARAAAGWGLTTHAVVRSPLEGPSGNVEFFLWLRATAPGDGLDGQVDEDGIRAVVTGQPAQQGGTA